MLYSENNLILTLTSNQSIADWLLIFSLGSNFIGTADWGDICLALYVLLKELTKIQHLVPIWDFAKLLKVKQA
jgi:hypothetical protein